VAQAELLPLKDSDFRSWKLLEDFNAALGKAVKRSQVHSSFRSPARLLHLGQYLSLFLFGLFNPILKTARAACEASHLKRVQEEVCGRPVSLTSFSEAQHLVNPDILKMVFGQLVGQLPPGQSGPSVLNWQQWFARDSSVFAALPRMTWALYGGGHAGAPNRAVRLHLNFNVLKDRPSLADITRGRICERKSWEDQLEAGAGYIGDRYYSKNYKLFGKLIDLGCPFVLRLAEEATITILEQIEVTEADRREGVVRQAWCILGKDDSQSVRVRVIWIEGKHTAMMLVTQLTPEVLPACMASILYRRRWQIECFFKWIKCLLGCRHWMAESQQGVALQLYLALIASVLLEICLGRRPNKRMLELIQLHQMGYASTEELIAGLKREQAKEEVRKKSGR